MITIHNPERKKLGVAAYDKVVGVPMSAVEQPDGFMFRNNLEGMPMQPVTGVFRESRTKPGTYGLKLCFTNNNHTVWLAADQLLLMEGLCVAEGPILYFVATSAAFSDGRFTTGDSVKPSAALPYLHYKYPSTPPSLGKHDVQLRVSKETAQAPQPKVISPSDLMNAPRPRSKSSNMESFQTEISTEQAERGKRMQRLVADFLKIREQQTPGMRIVELDNEVQDSVGYDFEVYQNDELLELIEVKSTTGAPGSAVKVSKEQWAKAIECHATRGQVSYWLYCVHNSGTDQPMLERFKDPVEWMTSGRMEVINDLVVQISDPHGGHDQ